MGVLYDDEDDTWVPTGYTTEEEPALSLSPKKKRSASANANASTASVPSDNAASSSAAMSTATTQSETPVFWSSEAGKRLERMNAKREYSVVEGTVGHANTCGRCSKSTTMGVWLPTPHALQIVEYMGRNADVTTQCGKCMTGYISHGAEAAGEEIQRQIQKGQQKLQEAMTRAQASQSTQQGTVGTQAGTSHEAD